MGFFPTGYFSPTYMQPDYWAEHGAGGPPAPTGDAVRFIVLFGLIFGGGGE